MNPLAFRQQGVKLPDKFVQVLRIVILQAFWV